MEKTIAQPDNELFSDEFVTRCLERKRLFFDGLFKEFPRAYKYWDVKINPLQYVECWNLGYPVMIQFIQDSIFVYGPWDRNCSTNEQVFQLIKKELNRAEGE